MTLLSSTKLVPELQYYFSEFVLNSSVNKYEINISSSIPTDYLQTKTFIEMLFNENYSYDRYNHLFDENTNRYSWPQIVKNRILIYPTSAKYYDCTDNVDGENLFNLTTEDLIMMDVLLAYRIDSTSVSIVTDSTPTSFINNVLYASYDDLVTGLSKLIYLYLDLKIYGRYSNYNNETLLSSNLLEYCYETFVLDKIFDIVSAKEIN